MRRMYSEKQIKGIVNKGIEAGEIEIPAGGTQLYKHIVTVGIEASFSVELMIISTKSTSYTLSDFAITEEQTGLKVPVSALAMGYRNIEETLPYQNCDNAIISDTAESGLEVLFSFGGTEIADFSDESMTTQDIEFSDDFQPY